MNTLLHVKNFPIVFSVRNTFSAADFAGHRDKDLCLFLPREVMRKRGLCCRLVSVRPSLSVMFMHCIQTPEDIVKLLSRPLSPIIVVFDPEHRYPVPRGTPSAGHKVNWVGKFALFG